ncbi:MAG TPA: S9 family peptidase [Polyangiaceae bacterium]|nr:S9 family peptidase [Polyangiaceae bacterium]
MRIQPLLVLFLAACGSSSKTGPEPASPPPVELPTPLQAHGPNKAAREQATSEADVPSGAAAARDAELAKGAAGLLDAFMNTGPVLSRDGKKVIFNSNRDGLPQLYVADAAKPESTAARLLATKERMVDARTTKDGKSIVFKSDKGADENWDFFRADLDGKNLTQLTSGEPLNRDAAHLPDGKPDTLLYSARKMSESASVLYVQPLQPGATPKKAYAETGFGVLADVSTDGKWGAWLRLPARTKGTLLVVDIDTGKEQVVYPSSGDVGIQDAAFSHDGKRLYVATDGGGDQALVLSFDTKTLKEVGRYAEAKPATAMITHLVASKKGNLVAVNLLAGNRSEVRLLDGTTLKPKVEVKLPLGSGMISDFSEDGRRLTLDRSTPEAPNDVHVVDVATGAVSPLRKEPRPSAPELATVETQLIEIPAHDGLKIPTNVYLPTGVSGKKLPTIVNFHGGPAGASVVRWDPIARFFLAQGYAWVEPNVRGSSGFGRAFEMADNGAKRAEAFKDIEGVGRWVGAQPWADKNKLIVFGGSYGGYTTLIALTRQADLWRAGVDLFGVANLPTFLKTTSGAIRELFKTEFGDLEKDADLLNEQSPLRQVDKIVDPLFVYAGANDPRVPKSESDLIVKALRERSVPVEYLVAMDEGHSLARRENRIALASRVARFLETELSK